MTIAKTIISQINAIDRRAIWAWGAKDFVNTGTGLQFKVGGLAKFKGHVHIKLDEGSDLYDIEFYKIRKGEIKVVHDCRGIFADNLVNVIDMVVQ